MIEQQTFQRRALDGFEHLRRVKPIARKRCVAQPIRQNQHTRGRLHQIVIEIGMHANGLICGQGPRRGGPDHRANFVRRSNAKARGKGCGIGDREAHVDRRGILVFVFDLGFGQRRAAVHAPVHGLGALVQKASLHDAAQLAHDVGFKLEVHRTVGMVPVTQHTKANKVGLLSLDLLGSVAAAQFAKLCRGNSLTVSLFHL